MIKLTEECKAELAKTMKVGLVATIDDEGDPHISLLSSIMAKDDKTMIIGEFITGLSKEFMRKRNKCGFFVMSLGKKFWRGAMTWRKSMTEGEDYIVYNDMPMYRYNTYCGINTVHYLDLDEISEKNVLPMGKIITNAIKTTIIKGKYKNDKKALSPWATKLMSRLDTLEFIAFVDKNGYPQIIPTIQAQASASSVIVLTLQPYKELLNEIPENARVAVFAMNLDMQSVLVKGVFSRKGKGVAIVEIDRVYNSMPPKHGYIYPPCETKALNMKTLE